MKSIILIAVIISLLSACDSGTLWKDGNYIVVWLDTHDNRTLGYDLGNGSSIGRVGAEVIAVGSNELYVIAKQRNPNSSKESYFYIEKSKDYEYSNQDEITKGPFTEAEFRSLNKKFSFPPFSKEFK